MPQTSPDPVELVDTAAATVGHAASSIWGQSLPVSQAHDLGQALIHLTSALIDLTDHLAYDIDTEITKQPHGTENLTTALRHLGDSKTALQNADTALRLYRYSQTPTAN